MRRDVKVTLIACSSVKVAFTSRDVLAAGAFASVVSGAPSTLCAFIAGDDILEASLAAGSMLLPRETRSGPLLLAAAVAHGALSFGWAGVFGVALPKRHTIAAGALAGLAVATLDLGVVGRRFPRIRALPLLPQIADHVAYGVAVATVLTHRRARREF
jgi:hypothetical protein